MKGVIFYIEDLNQSVKGDISVWTNTLEKYGVDFYIAVDDQNLEPNWEETKNIEGYRVDTFNQALIKLQEVHSECKTVYLTIDATKELKDFDHPLYACYVVGADSGEIPKFKADDEIKLYPQHIWAIDCIQNTLYDRFSKGG